MSRFKKYLLFIILGVLTHGVKAQQWSFVYIQGDKQTPFYVKLNDEMLPRYSKHFCIIPQLDPGPLNIEILFQQNEFAPQNFTVLVPENGFRGFLLTKKENDFALYDIQQRFYLYPGARGEDHLPEMLSVNKKSTTTPPAGNEQPKSSTSDEPLFIDNLELSNERVPETPPIDKPDPDNTLVETPEIPPVHEEVVVPGEIIPEEDAAISYEGRPDLSANDSSTNVNCPQPVTSSVFDNVYRSLKAESDQEERLNFLTGKTKELCFSTQQVHLLAKELDTESIRYSFLKKAFPRVTDQQNFQRLEDQLFETGEWKAYFRLIH